MPSGYNLDLIGRRFDRLVVLSAFDIRNGQKRWLCRCDCGNDALKATSDLTRQKHLGCKICEPITRAKAHVTHGDARGGGNKTSLYNVWCGMKQRCTDPKHVGWKFYGAKGIKLCDAWCDFEVFKTWAMAHGYVKGLTIERLASEADYTPDNCEWITRAENGRRAMQKRWAAHRLASL